MGGACSMISVGVGRERCGCAYIVTEVLEMLFIYNLKIHKKPSRAVEAELGGSG